MGGLKRYDTVVIHGLSRSHSYNVSKGNKILIVEDSPSQSAIIASIVEHAGHRPCVYNALPTGISQILTKEQPDLVLLDLMLLDPNGKPMADGFQICREIKRSPRRIPVIVISAEGDEDACNWALLQGADAYLQKPFNPEDLLEVMKSVLASDSEED